MSRIVLTMLPKLALLLFFSMLATSIPHATPVFAAGTFTVTTTSDTNAADTNVGNGSCAIAAGGCSLRAALQEANALGGATINFSIPTSDPNYNAGSGGYWTIVPTLRMPILTGGSITVDGTTQPNGRSDGPKIFLDGSNLTAGSNGFEIHSANNVIRGMGMFNLKSASSLFYGHGIYIDYQSAASIGKTANNNTVTQCWIGVNPSGAGATNGSYGVYIQGGSANTISNNVISANQQAALYLIGSNTSSYPNASNNQIVDNIIGTNPGGSTIISNGNPGEGISIQRYVQNTTIARNLISGFRAGGASAISAKGNGSGNITISDNIIGTSKDGLNALENIYGINISDNIDAVTISNNLISANASHGINIHADAASVGQISILNNRIGLGADNRALGNAGSGIAIYRANNNAIGVSSSTIRGNVISANREYGILIGFSSAQASEFANHVIAGNYIGTLPGGSSSNLDVLNTRSGIQIFSGANIRIGGSDAADRNILTARSTQASIRLTGANITGTTIQGNYLGLASNGSTALIGSVTDSAGYAVLVESGASNTTIAQNVIGANNNGIELLSSSNATIRANLIGTDATGTNLRGHRQFGVWLVNAGSVTVGGATAADANTIAGNTFGVFVDGTSTGNTFEKNNIHHNTQYGMQFKGSAASINTVRANVIQQNGSAGSYDGISIDAAQRILITQTTTQANTGDGIKLVNGGNANKAAPTLNATLDSGTNGEALVTGTAPGCGAGDCTIELFSSASRDDGEGPRYLNSTTTTSGGNFSIDAKDCDRFLTATARDQNGNTSAFSSPMVDTTTGCTVAKPTLSAGTPASSSSNPNIVNAPGNVTYQHTLTNSGGLPGTFTVSIASSNGWATSTDFPAAGVRLNAGQSYSFNVTVTVPANARGGPPADVTTVTATVGNFSDAKSNYTQLKQTFGVTIDTLSQQFTSTPINLDFEHTLVNTGNGVDTISISAVNATIPGTPGFSYPNGQQCVNLAPGASCKLIVRVSLASGSTGGTFTVTATAGGGASASATDTAYTRSIIPELSPATIDKQAYPSDVVTFVHTLKNVGTESGTFTIIPPTDNNEWTFNLLSNSTVTLGPGESQDISFTATVPAINSPNAIAGLKKSFVLQVQSEAGATTSATDSVTVLLKPQFEFGAATSPVSANPLDTVTFVHTLKNTSNGDDSYSINVTPTSGLEQITVSPASPISVARGASVQVTIQARVKAGTLASVDVEQLTVTAQSVSTPQPAAQTQIDKVTVLGSAVPVLSVEPTSTGPVQPGTSVELTYTLTNQGNQAGSFPNPVLSLPAVPAGWQASTPQPACGSLDPGQSCVFVVTITLPQNAYAGDNLVKATVASASATTVIKVAAVPGVLLEKDEQGNLGPGDTISYDHSLTNTGNLTATFSLSTQITSGWSVAAPTTLENVAPGASVQFTVDVTAPAIALKDSVGSLTITASSNTNPVVSDSVTDTTTIIGVSRATLTPDVQTSYTLAGQVAHFAPTLRNTGSVAIAYDLVVETAGWTSIVTPTQTVVLQPGDEITLELTVAVPAGTALNESNLTTLHVREKDTSTDLATGEYTTTTAVAGSILEPTLNEATVLPGTTHVYTHTLRNVGSEADTFLLKTIATNGWSVTVSPPSVFLQPGETRLIEVFVHVPAGLTAGLMDYSYLEVQALNTPQLNAIGTEITTVKKYADMSLTPSQSMIIEPDQEFDIQHTLLNLGNAADTYTISAQSEQGWSVSVTAPSNGSILLQQNGRYPVTVHVKVPTTIQEGTTDRITVLVRSQYDSSVSRSVVHTLRYPVTQEQNPTVTYSLWLPLIDAP